MSDCCSPKGYRSIFSEKRAHAEARRYRRRGLDRTSQRIAELLKQQGIVGRTLLEVGGGIGAIQIELLRAGITRAVNIELITLNPSALGLMQQGMRMGHGCGRLVNQQVTCKCVCAQRSRFYFIGR